MKKTISLILTLVLIVSTFSGCVNISGTATGKTTNKNPVVTELSSEELQKLISSEISLPFSNVDGSEKLTDNEIKEIVSKVPSDKYEAYPHLHNVPNSATLYKGNEIISIDVKDPRLIQLINFYNNSVYHNQYSYTQGLLNLKYLEENVENNNFRLELKYTPYTDTSTVPYDTTITLSDTIVVTNNCGFLIIAHDRPGYEGLENEYPFHAVGHEPLHYNYCWHDLFGF